MWRHAELRDEYLFVSVLAWYHLPLDSMLETLSLVSFGEKRDGRAGTIKGILRMGYRRW